MTPEQEKEAIALELELRKRAAAGSGPEPEPEPTPESGVDFRGQLKRAFPSTAAAIENYMKGKGSPTAKGTAPIEMAKLGMAALQDFTTYGARRVGELTGSSKMEDPEGGFLKPVRDDLREAFKKKLADNLSSNLPYLLKWARDRSLRVEDVVSNFAVSMLEDPSTILSAGAKGLNAATKFVPTLKSGVRQLGGLTEAEGAVERAAAKGGAGLEELKGGAVAKGKGEADVMATQIEGELESLAAAKQKEMDDAFTGLTDTHPIRAYHGTIRDFEKFDPAESIDDAGAGAFFTSKSEIADEAAHRQWEMHTGPNESRLAGQNIRPVKIRKPDLVIDFNDPADLKMIKEKYDPHLDPVDEGPELMQEIIKKNKSKNVIHFKNAVDFMDQSDITFVRNPDEAVKPLYGSKTAGRTKADVRGGQLRGAVDAAEKAKMKKFGAEEERTLGSIWDQPLAQHEATMLEPARNKAVDLQKQILSDINYKPGEDVTGYMGGRVFTKDDTDLLIRLTDDFNEVSDINEFLAKRRGVDGLISYDKDFENRDFLLKGLRTRMNNLIEESFYQNIKDPKKAENFAEAWRANNKFYAEMSDALGGVSRKFTKTEDYAKTLENMGIEKLTGVFDMAKKHPELAPVAEQIRAGYIDDFLLRATDTDGHIDFDKAKKVWSNLQESDKLMNTVLTKEQQSQIKFALDKFENTELPGRYLGRNRKIVADKLGKLSTDDKRYAAKEVEFLDALAGRTGKDAMSYRAMAMSQADQLDMDKAGRLPIIGTHMLSRAVGSFGSQLRSPWGVVHATKALNMLGDLPKDKLDAIFKGGAAAALASAASKQGADELEEEVVPAEEETPPVENQPPAENTPPADEKTGRKGGPAKTGGSGEGLGGDKLLAKGGQDLTEEQKAALGPKKKLTIDELRKRPGGIPLRIMGVVE